jgi:hypothetical protein
MEKENCIIKYKSTWSSWSWSEDVAPNLVINLKIIGKATKYNKKSETRVNIIVLERMGFTTK